MAMPTATPTAISTARRRRSPTVRPRVITAEMGAKKGSGWSSSSVATNQASAAAIGCVQDRPRGSRGCSPGASAARRARPRRPLEELVARRHTALEAPRAHRRYQRGETFGGGASRAFATSTVGSSRRRWWPSMPSKRSPRPSTSVGADAEGAGQRHEVGRVQVDALVRVALEVLVEAQHAVAAVVHDQRCERDPLLRQRGQLAAGVEEAAVAGHAHHRARPGQRCAETLGEGAAERAPAERVGELARLGRAGEAAQPVARDAHVADHHRVLGQGALHGVEEGERLGVALGQPGAHVGVERAQALAQRLEPAARRDPLGQPGGGLGGVGLEQQVGEVVLGRVGGVDVDRNQVRGLGLLPALGHHAVEVAAERDHHVGLVPQRPDLGHVRRGGHQAGVVGRQQAARRVGEDHRRHEALRQLCQRLARARLQRAAARPDQRPARALDQLQCAGEMLLVGASWSSPRACGSGTSVTSSPSRSVGTSR